MLVGSLALLFKRRQIRRTVASTTTASQEDVDSLPLLFTVFVLVLLSRFTVLDLVLLSLFTVLDLVLVLSLIVLVLVLELAVFVLALTVLLPHFTLWPFMGRTTNHPFTAENSLAFIIRCLWRTLNSYLHLVDKWLIRWLMNHKVWVKCQSVTVHVGRKARIDSEKLFFSISWHCTLYRDIVKYLHGDYSTSNYWSAFCSRYGQSTHYVRRVVSCWHGHAFYWLQMVMWSSCGCWPS